MQLQGGIGVSDFLEKLGYVIGEATPTEFYFITDENKHPPRWEYVLVKSTENINGEEVEVDVIAQIDAIYSSSLALSGKPSLEAVEKIIDMNLDVLTSSYREEELSKFLSMSRIEKNILAGLKNFNSYINYFLAGALALVAFFAIGLFVYDIYLLFFTDIKIEKGILTVLGSLLVLWASIELIHEEIKHLQGQGFAIGAFIMLAMAALIRKILIYSLCRKRRRAIGYRPCDSWLDDIILAGRYQ